MFATPAREGWASHPLRRCRGGLAAGGAGAGGGDRLRLPPAWISCWASPARRCSNLSDALEGRCSLGTPSWSTRHPAAAHSPPPGTPSTCPGRNGWRHFSTGPGTAGTFCCWNCGPGFSSLDRMLAPLCGLAVLNATGGRPPPVCRPGLRPAAREGLERQRLVKSGPRGTLRPCNLVIRDLRMTSHWWAARCLG